MKTIYVASSNKGKLRDFAAAAQRHGIDVRPVPGLEHFPAVPETGDTFEANARLKAEAYSRALPGAIVLADDSGLAVDALGGAPGVKSARYAAELEGSGEGNSPDADNNARLLRELIDVPHAERGARFISVIAAARDGRTLATFQGSTPGTILSEARGTGGFGYDPLFYAHALGKTFAELTPEEKIAVSHRGKAFAQFLEWYETHTAS